MVLHSGKYIIEKGCVEEVNFIYLFKGHKRMNENRYLTFLNFIVEERTQKLLIIIKLYYSTWKIMNDIILNTEFFRVK